MPAVMLTDAEKQKRAKKRKFTRMRQRIEREFDKKFFIGDITVSEEEYLLLLEYTRELLSGLFRSGNSSVNDPLLAVAMVQIGITQYDGNFWDHAEEALYTSLGQKEREILSAAFLNTLKLHRKYLPSTNGCVQTVLFHGFVSNYFSKGLFELLFHYYSRDLERNIYRNTPEQMQALMDTLSKKAEEDERTSAAFMSQFMGKGSQAYKLPKHTLQAISVQPIHSRTRLRRLLRLIDRAFWNDLVPKNPRSRLTILFKEWIQESPAFNQEYRLYKRGEIQNRGKKHFSAPYLYADILGCSFELHFPSQLVSEEYAEHLEWEITTSERTFRFPVDTYPALTGYKTEERSCKIGHSELFGGFRCQLICMGEQVRRFPPIPECEVRFFDMEGDIAYRLFKVPMCAYTHSSKKFQSSALIDQIHCGDLTRWDFEFELGDLVILPDGSGMIVGDHYADGFLPRGKVSNAVYHSADDGTDLPVYAALPELLLTASLSKLAGAVVYIDDVRFPFSDCQYSEFDTADSHGDHAVLFPLAQFSALHQDGIHSIVVDLPGAVYAQKYEFVYVNGLKAEFDGSPYIFEERGTLIFPDHIRVSCEYDRLYHENGFQFELDGNTTSVSVTVNDQIDLDIQIPVLSWSTDKQTWQIAPAGELWHTDFFRMKKIYLRSPNSKISFSADTDIADDEEIEQRTVTAECDRDGVLCVDMTRFQSWLTRDIMKNRIIMKVGKQEFTFATVYTRSLVSSSDVHADYEEGILSCFFDIIGMSSYYIDITHVESGQRIAVKRPLLNGRLELPDPLRSGRYQFIVYEAEYDDSGFDDLIYEQIHTETKRLINKNDISGQFLEIRKFKLRENSNLYTKLGAEYMIVDLKKIGRQTYSGNLLINRNESPFRVEVFFPDQNDLRFFDVTFWHDEEEINVPFLFDCNSKQLVKDENPNLRAAERYRRYRVLDDETYIYFGLSYTELPTFELKEHLKHPALFKEEIAKYGVPIEDMHLKLRTYNCLKCAGIQRSGDLDGMTLEELSQIRHMGRFGIIDIIAKAPIYGFQILDSKETK